MPLSGKKVQAALLGPDGTFTAEAGYRNGDRRGYEIEPRWCKSITDCFRAVIDGGTEIGVVPMVNSTSTAYQVNETMACLREYGDGDGIRVYDEEVVPIAMQLAALPGTVMGDIREIWSKDKALQQCTSLRHIVGHDYSEVPTESTAGAAERLVEDGVPYRAVIVPRRAVELYGLHVLAPDVQDNKSNWTRFHVIAKRDHEPTGKDATKIMYEHRDVEKPRLLHRTTGVIDGVNIRYMQLLPVDGSLHHLTFFMDLDGHRTDPTVSHVLERLGTEDYIKRFVVLGSYPVFPDI